MKTQTLTKTGLEVYETYDVWQISEDRECAVFATPGIIISIRYYGEDPGLTKQYQNVFVVDFQYDYRNPDKIDSFDFVQHSGTYGRTLFFDSLEIAMKKCEELMEEDFEGVREFGGTKILSKAKIPIREVAKKAFFHHQGQFPDLHDFRTKALYDSKYALEAAHYRQRYINRRFSDEKYRLKLDKVFLEEFGWDVHEIVYQWTINVREFLIKIKKPKATRDDLKKSFSKRKFKIFDKVFKYYHV